MQFICLTNMWKADQQSHRKTNNQTGITTYRQNQSRGWISENLNLTRWGGGRPISDFGIKRGGGGSSPPFLVEICEKPLINRATP